jgi:hypothetical protein
LHLIYIACMLTRLWSLFPSFHFLNFFLFFIFTSMKMCTKNGKATEKPFFTHRLKKSGNRLEFNKRLLWQNHVSVVIDFIRAYHKCNFSFVKFGFDHNKCFACKNCQIRTRIVCFVVKKRNSAKAMNWKIIELETLNHQYYWANRVTLKKEITQVSLLRMRWCGTVSRKLAKNLKIRSFHNAQYNEGIKKYNEVK